MTQRIDMIGRGNFFLYCLVVYKVVEAGALAVGAGGEELDITGKRFAVVRKSGY